jgi:hypothetical protein
MASSSGAARIAVLLNSSEHRRDPWNISLPTEFFFANDSHECHTSTLSTLSMDFSVPKKSAGWAFLVQRSWGDAENAYYRAWNDPPLSTVRDCLDFVQQLLEVSLLKPLALMRSRRCEILKLRRSVSLPRSWHTCILLACTSTHATSPLSKHILS